VSFRFMGALYPNNLLVGVVWACFGFVYDIVHKFLNFDDFVGYVKIYVIQYRNIKVVVVILRSKKFL